MHLYPEVLNIYTMLYMLYLVLLGFSKNYDFTIKFNTNLQALS